MTSLPRQNTQQALCRFAFFWFPSSKFHFRQHFSSWQCPTVLHSAPPFMCWCGGEDQQVVFALTSFFRFSRTSLCNVSSSLCWMLLPPVIQGSGHFSLLRIVNHGIPQSLATLLNSNLQRLALVQQWKKVFSIDHRSTSSITQAISRIKERFVSEAQGM